MLRSLFVFVMLLVLSGCTGEDCYDADDFGFANFNVSSRYTKEEMNQQKGDNQVAPWVNSNYRVNGRPLAILVRHWDYETNRNSRSETSAWCPWFGDVGDEDKLSDFCHRLQDCIFIDNQMCSNNYEAEIANAPCILRKGIGLYALITTRDDDPNTSLSKMRNPDGISFHLGVQQTDYAMLDITKDGEMKNAGGRVYLYDSATEGAESLKSNYADGPLYFKILDRYYDDNSGQYRVSIKSGVHVVNPDPISYVIRLVKDFMFGEGEDDYGLIRRLYEGVINNPGYRLAVSSLLTLYILYTGLAYLTGNVELSNKELIIRIIKVAIISTLISSEMSWRFFHDYLFVFFVGGVEQILQMIIAAGATGPGAPGILAMMIAPQTMAKVVSLLFVDWRGFIYIILFIIALAFVIKVFFDAAVIYLTALMAIGLMIVMAPIFICFLLFDFTRSLFENWLRQIMSYAVQPIILFTGLVFISVILREEIYGSLGFRVCKHFFPDLGAEADIFGELSEEVLGVDLGRSPFYWWFPEPMKGSQFSKNMITIPIPIDHFDNDGDFCEAYGCFGERYADLPFLDPNTERGLSRINKFHNGEFVQLDGLFLIFLALFLLYKFNTLTISMAKFITNTSGSFTDVGKTLKQGISGSSHSLKSFKGVGMRAFRRTDIGRKAYAGRAQFKAKKKEAKQFIPKSYDERAIRGLQAEALSSKATKSVLAEVEQKTGLRQSDVIRGSMDRYQEALAENLKEIDPSLTDTQARKIAKGMSNTNYKKIHQELAKAKYGDKADFSKLSKEQQDEINAMIDKKYGSDGDRKSLKELAIDARNEKRFKDAYVDAHQAMSFRGIGIFGKENKKIQEFDEFKHRYKQAGKDKKQERRMRGEYVMSGVEGVKSSAYSGITGEGADKSEIGKKFFGGGYHDINQRDPGLRTYDETLKQQRVESKYTKYDRNIEAFNKKEGTSVVAPEFIADRKASGDIRVDSYRGLARQGIEGQVHRELYGGKDPVIKGDTYMRNYAKDSEMVEMVDRAQLAKERIFDNDQYISREDSYENELKEASSAIDRDITNFRDAFGDNLEPEKMPEQLREYLYKYNEGKEEGDRLSDADINEYADDLKKNIDKYEHNQLVLQEIDERKIMVTEEVNKEIEHINKARVASGMEEYYGNEKGIYEVRDWQSLGEQEGSGGAASGIGSSADVGDAVGSDPLSEQEERAREQQKEKDEKLREKEKKNEKAAVKKELKKKEEQAELEHKAHEESLKEQGRLKKLEEEERARKEKKDRK